MSAFDGQADLLATLIASTATFQSVTGTSTVPAAKNKVGLHEALDEDDETAPQILYPRAIIADGGIIERMRVGTGTWMGSGSMFLSFEFEAPTDKTTTKAQRAWFLEKTSAIMREAEVIADSRATPTGYTTSHLHIRKYKRTAGPSYIQVSEREQPPDTDNPLRVLWAIEVEIEY